jgi:alkylated DNA repair dioxygenase AlkB
MYDRDVDVPRLTSGYRLSDDNLPAALAEAARRTIEATGAPFNRAGLNLYRDGRDSVAPHNDHLYEIVAGYPIALISLGATRLMTIRSKTKPRRLLDLDLEEGSLLLMSYETQFHYDHGVPKTRAAVGPRISLALRVRPDEPSKSQSR